MNEGVECGNRTISRLRPVVRSVLGLTLLLGIPVAGPSPYLQFPSPNSGQYGQHYPDSNSPFGQDPNSPEQKRIRALNAERQKSLVSDAEKLLKLAKELNLADGPYTQLAFELENILLQGRWRMRMNVAALAVVLAADQGLTEREYYLFLIPCFTAGIMPCFIEANERHEGGF